MTNVTEIPAGTYTIDASHTEVGFVARHAMVTKVRGYFRDAAATAGPDDDMLELVIDGIAGKK